MLRRLGWEAHGATNAVEVSEVLQECGDQLTVAVVDLGLGRENGSDAARLIWQAQPELPVVVMSGSDEAEYEEALEGLPVAGFLSKPFEPSSMDLLLRGVSRTDSVRSAS